MERKNKETIQQSRHSRLIHAQLIFYSHDNQRTHARTHGLMIFQTSKPTMTHAGRRRLQGRRLLPHRAITSGRIVRSQQPLQLHAPSA
jgi:hypothetical protein